MSDDKKFHYTQKNYALLAANEYWTISEAIQYITIYSLKNVEWATQEKASEAFKNHSDELTEIVKRSVNSKKLIIDKVYTLDYDDEYGEITCLDILSSKVNPRLFVEWATDKKFQIPNEFSELIKIEENPNSPSDDKPSDKLLRPDQKAKERCRAIAEMLWDQNKTIKTKEMIIRPEIEKYGTRSMFEPKTVYGWIKDLAPKNRMPEVDIDDSDG